MDGVSKWKHTKQRASLVTAAFAASVVVVVVTVVQA